MLPPWPMIEAMMGKLIGTGPGASGEDTPQGQAQQLLLRAYQVGSDGDAVELARLGPGRLAQLRRRLRAPG
jgi:hypothetical protein